MKKIVKKNGANLLLQVQQLYMSYYIVFVKLPHLI